MTSKEIEVVLAEVNNPKLESTIDVIGRIKYQEKFKEENIERCLAVDDFLYVYMTPKISKYRILVSLNRKEPQMIEMVELVPGTRVYLSISSDELLLDQIQEIVGFEPTKSWNKPLRIGGRRVNRAIFQVELSDVLSEYFHTKIDALLEFLKNHKQAIKNVSKRCSSTFRIVEWRYHLDSGGMYLEPEQLKTLASLGVRLDFETYLEE